MPRSGRPWPWPRTPGPGTRPRSPRPAAPPPARPRTGRRTPARSSPSRTSGQGGPCSPGEIRAATPASAAAAGGQLPDPAPAFRRRAADRHPHDLVAARRSAPRRPPARPGCRRTRWPATAAAGSLPSVVQLARPAPGWPGRSPARPAASRRRAGPGTGCRPAARSSAGDRLDARVHRGPVRVAGEPHVHPEPAVQPHVALGSAGRRCRSRRRAARSRSAGRPARPASSSSTAGPAPGDQAVAALRRARRR